MLWVDGKPTRVSRIVCERKNGPEPFPGAQAAHFCGNATCVNPSHLRWATKSENELDKVKHGTHHRGERHHNRSLTEEDVRRIRKLCQTMLHREVASMFGIHRMTVGKIARRKRWAWLED
ncbi:HNH endonuclease [Sphingopyxis sp. PET50]|uniref:HNH endonuclease n=1 Tax=Sphingopyxis sp. PET50 TaxID=2976533 RepID=UPI00391B3903